LICVQEYKGKNCEEVKVKTCRERPCLNEGTCIDVPLSSGDAGAERYRCDCPQGYEGKNCDYQIDYCVKLNVHCQNGGSCKSDFSSFVSWIFCCKLFFCTDNRISFAGSSILFRITFPDLMSVFHGTAQS
jgi:hypothetical protein